MTEAAARNAAIAANRARTERRFSKVPKLHTVSHSGSRLGNSVGINAALTATTTAAIPKMMAHRATCAVTNVIAKLPHPSPPTRESVEEFSESRAFSWQFCRRREWQKAAAPSTAA